MMVRIAIIFLCCLSFFVRADQSQNSTIRLATTTSVENSGLLDALLSEFEIDYPRYSFDVITVGSGKALRMGRRGKADLVLVHAPNAERKFINDGFGEKRYPVLKNFLLIAGPKDDPSGIASSGDVFDALRKIAQTQSKFVSRGDDSGTHRKELSLWRTLLLEPFMQDWYIESGTGMANTLKMAELEGAYLLIDKATFLVRKGKEFAILFEDRENLASSYYLIPVSPSKVPDVNFQGASDFANWIASAKGQRHIADFSHQGTKLYELLSQ